MEEITNVRIAQGDNLSRIAKNHFTTVDKLVELNPNIKDKNLIIVGDTLKVPITIFEEQEKLENKNEIPVKEFSLINDSTTIPKTPISPKKSETSKESNILKYTSLALGAIVTGVALFKFGKLGQAKKIINTTPQKVLYPTPKAQEAINTIKNIFDNNKVNYKKIINKSIAHKPTVKQHQIKLNRLNKAFGVMTPNKKAQEAIANIEKIYQKPTNYQQICETYIPQMPQEHKSRFKELKKVFR